MMGPGKGRASNGPRGSSSAALVPTDTHPVSTPVEKEDLHVLKKEKEEPVAPELAELAATVPESAEPEAEADGEELDGSDMSAIIYEIPKEPEKWVLGQAGERRDEERPLGPQPSWCQSPDAMGPSPPGGGEASDRG